MRSIDNESGAACVKFENAGALIPNNASARAVN
jgi:hypothetical protein